MATAARILVLLMVTLAFANAQCLTMCSIQPCHADPAGRCPQHSGKAVPPSCSHGQFARTAEIQASPRLVFVDAAPVLFVEEVGLGLFSVEGTIEASPPLKLSDL